MCLIHLLIILGGCLVGINSIILCVCFLLLLLLLLSFISRSCRPLYSVPISHIFSPLVFLFSVSLLLPVCPFPYSSTSLFSLYSPGWFPWLSLLVGLLHVLICLVLVFVVYCVQVLVSLLVGLHVQVCYCAGLVFLLPLVRSAGHGSLVSGGFGPAKRVCLRCPGSQTCPFLALSLTLKHRMTRWVQHTK